MLSKRLFFTFVLMVVSTANIMGDTLTNVDTDILKSVSLPVSNLIGIASIAVSKTLPEKDYDKLNIDTVSYRYRTNGFGKALYEGYSVEYIKQAHSGNTSGIEEFVTVEIGKDGKVKNNGVSVFRRFHTDKDIFKVGGYGKVIKNSTSTGKYIVEASHLPKIDYNKLGNEGVSLVCAHYPDIDQDDLIISRISVVSSFSGENQIPQHSLRLTLWRRSSIVWEEDDMYTSFTRKEIVLSISMQQNGKSNLRFMESNAHDRQRKPW